RGCEARDEREDDRRVAEREEEPRRERPPPVLELAARDVVDRRNVVGVERVPQAEGVRQRAEPRERGMGARVEDEQSPAGDVEGRDGAGKCRDAAVHACASSFATARPAPRRSQSRWYTVACASWIRGTYSDGAMTTWSATPSAAIRPPS